MAWGSTQTATQLTSITTEQFFAFGGSSALSLNPGESMHFQVDVNFPTSPTDHAIVSVYGTLDDSSENWDDTPALTFSVDKAIDPNAASFIISDLYRFRVGVKRSGTTDTLTSADAKYRKNGISV